MANMLHSSLTGADLHETKGAAAAASGQVPIANGSGSAPFGYLQWSQINNKPLVPTVYLNDTALTASTIIKHYTVTPAGGVWSVGITGFAAVHNVLVSCISGGSGLGSDAIATVRSFSTTSATGSVVVLSASANNLGTNQPVRVTVIGV